MKSATKIVFILMTLALIAFTYLDKIDPKDFYAVALVVFYHYYNKNNTVDKPIVSS
jgi:hypothetical protein